MKEVIIQAAESGQRLDKFLLKYLNQSTKSFLYKMLRKKRIKYNGGKASGNEIIQPGDHIQLYLAEDTIQHFQKEKEIIESKISFSIVYEDANIILMNKPAGLLCHPGSNQDKETLVQQMLYYLSQNSNACLAEGFTPSLCNRLDRNTSGLVIGGKSLQAVQAVHLLHQEKKIYKAYKTIVKGVIEKPLAIQTNYHKNGDQNIASVADAAGPYAETIITPIRTNGVYTLLEVELKTGRSHQIRAHLKHIGHPIVGDPKYGDPDTNLQFYKKYGLGYQFLHAEKLQFQNNDTVLNLLNNHMFYCPLPYHLQTVQTALFQM